MPPEGEGPEGLVLADVSVGQMSQLGQSRHADRAPLTSGLRRLADILRGIRHVSKWCHKETHASQQSEIVAPLLAAR
jgi:hypothetical protein